jgi:CPSF A subunit region
VCECVCCLFVFHYVYIYMYVSVYVSVCVYVYVLCCAVLCCGDISFTALPLACRSSILMKSLCFALFSCCRCVYVGVCVCVSVCVCVEKRVCVNAWCVVLAFMEMFVAYLVQYIRLWFAPSSLSSSSTSASFFLLRSSCPCHIDFFCSVRYPSHWCCFFRTVHVPYAAMASRGGRRLLPVADFHLGFQTSASTRLRTRSRQKAYPVHASLFGSTDGAVASLIPLDERSYRRLAMLNYKLITSVPHAAGLNPQAYRYV